VSKSEITLKVSYANNTAQSYTVTLNPSEKYTLSQSYSWVRDSNSRFNLQAYSIDNSPYQTIERVARGNFTLDIPSDSSHFVVFLAVTQFPVEVNGTNSAVFSPSSQTNDNWFDLNSGVKITLPYVVKLDQNTRAQLMSWSLDGSSNNQITRQESGSFSTPTISISGPHMVNFGYITQYYVNIISEFGRVTGIGWYDSGNTATISVVPSQDFPIGHTFAGWQGAEGSSNSINIVVDSPKTLTAYWKSDYSIVMIIGASIAGGAVGSVVIYRKRKPSIVVPPQVVTQREEPATLEIQTPKQGQIDNTYAKELSSYILKKSIEKLDSFKALGVLSLQRYAKLKEDLAQDESDK
jgi:uncharacterized repeat protein (TIGR02543 family)